MMTGSIKIINNNIVEICSQTTVDKKPRYRHKSIPFSNISYISLELNMVFVSTGSSFDQTFISYKDNETASDIYMQLRNALSIYHTNYLVNKEG